MCATPRARVRWRSRSVCRWSGAGSRSDSRRCVRPHRAKPATPPARPRAAAPAPAAPTPIVPAAEPVTAATATNGHRAVDTVDTEDERLAIPGYDALSASQVVERLAGLSGDELDAVRRYEAGHRRRRTILGKIEQLSI